MHGNDAILIYIRTWYRTPSSSYLPAFPPTLKKKNQKKNKENHTTKSPRTLQKCHWQPPPTREQQNKKTPNSWDWPSSAPQPDPPCPKGRSRSGPCPRSDRWCACWATDRCRGTRRGWRS